MLFLIVRHVTRIMVSVAFLVPGVSLQRMFRYPASVSVGGLTKVDFSSADVWVHGSCTITTICAYACRDGLRLDAVS